MDPLWLVMTFALGLGARQIGLPPMVGFLVAGFALQLLGIHVGTTIDVVADLGVTLLLFTIGLKLRLKNLAKAEILAGTTLHTVITVTILAPTLLLLGRLGLPLVEHLDLSLAMLVAFALAFSSTVFAVKVLEERGEMEAPHGRIAINILVVQDLIAVAFLAFSKGEIPSPWALVLIFGLLLARPLLGTLMDRAGHGELLMLFGFALAFGLATPAFELVGLKPALGALIVGALFARHPKASELSKSLLGFKDLFLIGFFLQIGLSGSPTLAAAALALGLAIFVPIKGALFFLLLSRFKRRARTSFFASLSLTNYSEFGLLVAALAVREGWLDISWVIVVALAVSFSFVISAPLNATSPELFRRLRSRLMRFETEERLPEDRPIDTGNAEILICGMGMVGVGAYGRMQDRYGKTVLGVDFDPENVERQRAAGRNVVVGDATDTGFWEQIDVKRLRMVMLSIPNHLENLLAAERLRSRGFKGLVSATALYNDEVTALEAAGVDAAFNFFSEAGSGFADHACLKGQGEPVCVVEPPQDDR